MPAHAAETSTDTANERRLIRCGFSCLSDDPRQTARSRSLQGSTARNDVGRCLDLPYDVSARRTAGNRADRLQGCLDRKSTRLNSSHSQISYAVFCLKKKKKKNIQ